MPPIQTPKQPDSGTPQPMPGQEQVSFFTKLLALRNEANVARLRSETTNEDVIGTLITELATKEQIIGVLKQRIEKIDKMYKELVDKEAKKGEKTPEPEPKPEPESNQ